MNPERAEILADRYEELGDGERAELIRTQLALEHKPAWSAEHSPLTERARELLVRGHRRWIAELPILQRARYTRFQRGFVGGLEMRPGADLEPTWNMVREVVPIAHVEIDASQLSLLPVLPGLTSLQIHGRIDPQHLNRAVFQGLLRLDLRWARFDQQAVDRLASFELGLTDLDLGRHALGDGIVPLVRSTASTLRSFRSRSQVYSHAVLTDAGAAAFGPLPRLLDLDLGGLGGDDGLSHHGLAALLQGVPELRSLALSAVLIKNEALLDGLDLLDLSLRYTGVPLNLRLPNLKSLRLASVPCSVPEGLHLLELSPLATAEVVDLLQRDWPELHTLEVPEQAVPAEALAGATLPALRQLNVSGQDWTSLRALHAASWWAGLEQVRLCLPRLREGELGELAQLSPRLRRLDLAGTSIDGTDVAGVGTLDLTDLRLQNQRRPEPVADLGRYAWRSLISLSLTDCLLTNEHLDDWFGSPLPCLQELDLSYNPLDDEILWGIRRRARELRSLTLLEVAQSHDAAERLERSGLSERLWDVAWTDSLEIELRGRPLTYTSPI